ncbi:alpha/beta fold hydrolase [Candidatus Nitrospira inopinata]|jgi:3-oxoadipate enol-lactonase|uniref:Putative 3-oxoadipate enol-lactonase n=1 Tax=Candidatus Nitrospira inopinata TaxID=1715989 RepID=A0A0S4KNC6_9BACT|nr:alpha/beta fold hydrolase [Candidatus Nitrospira inopinata]CUQ65948.1 putative 3-oxoadipate enol-lactonase [Candidatus Nitrospira inopinata]
MNVHVNGISLAYSDQGKGLPLIFLHAFPLNRTMWEPQVEALSSEFRIVTVDLRGHGESDAPLWRYTLDQAAEDVRALMDHLSIGQAVLVGLSMGGYILFAFHRRYPDRIKGLILANTRAQGDTAEGKEARFQMAQIAYKKGPAAVADLIIPKLLSPLTIETRPDLVRRVRAMIESTEVSGIAGDLMAMAERTDSIPLLGSITCPVHVIAGELDQATPPADAKLMADRIAGSRFTVIPQAGHLSNLEQPDAFNRVVRAFSGSLAGT